MGLCGVANMTFWVSGCLSLWLNLLVDCFLGSGAFAFGAIWDGDWLLCFPEAFCFVVLCNACKTDLWAWHGSLWLWVSGFGFLVFGFRAILISWFGFWGGLWVLTCYGCVGILACCGCGCCGIVLVLLLVGLLCLLFVVYCLSVASWWCVG